MVTKKAFTLIELLAVIVIVAIVATIGIYSATVIMAKARINSLTDTAFAVRKAASLYISSNDVLWVDNQKKLNMTPEAAGITLGENANLVELSKDPWGKAYENVEVILTRDGAGKITIDVYLYLIKGDWYLKHGDSELTEIVFEAQSLVANGPVEINADAIITYTLPGNYEVDDLDVKVYEDLDPEILAVMPADYTLEPLDFVKDGSGRYSVTLKLKSHGTFHVSIIVKNGADTGIESDKVAVVVLPPPFSFSSITENYGFTFTLANPRGTSMVGTVKAWNGTAWVDLTVNRPILANTQYGVNDGSGLGVGFSAPSYYSFWDNNTASETVSYRIRLIITDGIDTLTQDTDYSYVYQY